ncbi:hypothetical protein ACP4OV_023169 [Aristida adscensionis]
MITKMEGKNYFPGYIDMADSSVNLNVNLLAYHEENKSSRHFNDKFTMISTNGSLDYDKEMLKRTMLVHEATFRKQVYELHRLYRTQKDLMSQFQRDEFNSYPRYVDTVQPMSSYSSQAPSGDVKGAWQAGFNISGHDLKQASAYLMNGGGTQCSANGTPLKHNTIRSSKKMLDLELPAQVYADDDDDDEVEILDEKPSNSLPWANGSVRGGNIKTNLGSSESSSHVEKSWITDIQPRRDSMMHRLNKPVEESSNMGTTDFLGVGTSTAQNQHYLSGRVNINVLSFEARLKEKCTGKLSGGNEEIRHSNSFRQKQDEPSTNMAWLTSKQNSIDSSMGHLMFSSSSTNHLILARPSSNEALNSPWKSKDTSYMANCLNGTVEVSISKNVLSNGVSMESAPNTPKHHPLNSHRELKHRKGSPVRDFLQGINLNEAPQDVTQDAAATWDEGSGNSVIDASSLKKKPVDLMKSEVPLNCTNGHSQNLVGSSSYSEVRSTAINFGLPTSAATEQYPWCTSTLHSGTNTAPSFEREADIEMQSQKTTADMSTKNFIDLNEALPLTDDPEMDLVEPECDIAPREPGGDIAHPEPDDPSRESLDITVAESLVAMRSGAFRAGSSQLDTLHWFADLATLKENATSDNDTDDDFEALTLKLQETKGCEYHSPPREQEDSNNKGGHCSAASLLMTRPRRGQARGRCRKKDFQRDVLPGLASLSKQEVSEDLYALGWSTPATLAKRGGRRNGQQPRGRRRARSVVVTVEEEARVSPPPVPPPLVSDLDADALGITRWGRTIRRCRRPRCPPAKILS